MNSIDRSRNIRNLVAGPRAQRALKIGAIALPGAALILFASFLLLRDIILESTLDNKIRSYQRRHQETVVSVGSARFDGLDRMVFENIRLWSRTGTLSVDLRSCSVEVSFWKMLAGRVRPTDVEMNDLRIDLRRDSVPDQGFPRGRQ